jgi:undecaprenyl-diphosphatase
MVGGVLMILAEKYKNHEKAFKGKPSPTVMEVSPSDMWKIGLLQAFSLIPGISRSACTIGTALFLGLPRTLAVDLSFFLSIPVSIAGSFFDLYGEFSTVRHNYRLLSVCFIGNIFFSLFIIKRIMRYLRAKDLCFFGYYRLALGILLLMPR